MDEVMFDAIWSAVGFLLGYFAGHTRLLVQAWSWMKAKRERDDDGTR